MDQSRFNFYNFYNFRTDSHYNFKIKINNNSVFLNNLDIFDYNFIENDKIKINKNKKFITQKNLNKLHLYKIHNKKNVKNFFLF